MSPIIYDGSEFLIAIPGKTKDEYFDAVGKWYGQRTGFIVYMTGEGLMVKFDKYLTPMQKEELLRVLKEINYTK